MHRTDSTGRAQAARCTTGAGDQACNERRERTRLRSRKWLGPVPAGSSTQRPGLPVQTWMFAQTPVARPFWQSPKGLARLRAWQQKHNAGHVMSKIAEQGCTPRKGHCPRREHCGRQAQCSRPCHPRARPDSDAVWARGQAWCTAAPHSRAPEGPHALWAHFAAGQVYATVALTRRRMGTPTRLVPSATPCPAGSSSHCTPGPSRSGHMLMARGPLHRAVWRQVCWSAARGPWKAA